MPIALMEEIGREFKRRFDHKNVPKVRTIEGSGIFLAFGAMLTTLPKAVLGGCTIMMFGNIVISGLQMIGDCGFGQRNITIAALPLRLGLGFTQVLARIFFGEKVTERMMLLC